MTDKEQIIIDGVDVNGCENYKPKDRFTCYAHICNCHERSTCYFKQLARKTQEYKELAKDYDRQNEWLQQRTQEYDELLEDYKELDNRANRMIEEKYNLGSECEKWKHQAKLGSETTDRLSKQLEEKEQECEELERKLELIPCVDQVLQIGYEAYKKQTEYLLNENARYRKALEEIEAATKINCEEICGRKFEDCNDIHCFSAEILDIINKVKEGK